MSNKFVRSSPFLKQSEISENFHGKSTVNKIFHNF